MKIWRCPQCNSGVRAPARMRRDNALRYCLKCTAKTGKLAERVCPSAESERARRAAEAKTLAERKRQSAAAKGAAYAQTERGQLEALCREWMKLNTFWSAREVYGLNVTHRRPWTFQVRLTAPRKDTRLVRTEETNPDGSYRGATYTEFERTRPRPAYSTGRAWWHRNHFCLTAGTDPDDARATILHELAHLATPKDRGHGPQWRAVFQDAVREVTGQPELRLTGSNKHEYHRSAVDAMRAWREGAGAPADSALPSEAT